VAQRQWQVIVPMATALLVYLVLPNQFLAAGDRATVLHESGTSPEHAYVSDLAFGEPGEPVLASDEVATAPRGTSQAHPSTTVHASSDPAGPLDARLATVRAHGYLRPDLNALQTLRC
jgi:hypothetical protein